MFIRVKKGLDIPIAGSARGGIVTCAPSKQVSLTLSSFDSVHFKLLTKLGDRVKIGTPLAENKNISGQLFVSPGSGVVSEIRRGLKRALTDIVITCDSNEESENYGSLSPHASKEEILSHLMKGGLFPHLHMRPFHLIANPKYLPRDIFVVAYVSLPFVPSAEMQLQGNEEEFQMGLSTLAKLTKGKVYLGMRENSRIEAEGVEKCFLSGPHPAGSASLLIHNVKPIANVRDVVWTLSTVDCIAIGHMMKSGKYYTKRVIATAGNALFPEKREFLKSRAGVSFGELLSDRVEHPDARLISGDPLTGVESKLSDFLRVNHTCLSCIPENREREPFHFLGTGADKYSATRAYLSGHLKKRSYSFTTNQHGEERPFVDGAIYEKVMPMRIPTMSLVKAVLAENYELAVTLGLLEVEPADFALPSFICPSKIEMIDIIKKGLHAHARDVGYL